MDLLLITNYPFPYGMAQTNRLIAISKGLIYGGANVKVIISKSTEYGETLNKKNQGNYEGIRYKYATKKTDRSRYKIMRAYFFFFGIINTLRIINKEKRTGNLDAIFIGVHSNIITTFLLLQAKIIGIKAIHERSEFPFLSYKKGFIGRKKLKYYLKKICPNFDGFIVISKALDNYFEDYLKPSTKRFLLPILVETERFEKLSYKKKNQIAYCGSMQGNKDGVPILIEAFKKISDKFPDTRLKLIGSTNFNEFSKLKERVNELNLSDRIEFTGRIERDELPKHLAESRILALSRPPSKQAEGGFPTKLGEYLATGSLTIVTKVSDIPDYLTHMKDSLLAEPGNIEDFATMLEIGLKDNLLCEKIGSEGRKLANEIFNYRIQGMKLIEWLKTLV